MKSTLAVFRVWGVENMSRSMWRSTRVLLASGVLGLSGLLAGTALASDPSHVASLMKTRSCANCDLSGADLSGWTLPKTDLHGANLSGAKLYKATLTEANLTGANLTNCDLTGANLLKAEGADLANAKTDARTTCPNAKAGPCK